MPPHAVAACVQAHPDAFTEALLALESLEDDVILPSDHKHAVAPRPPAPPAGFHGQMTFDHQTGGADGPAEEKSRRSDNFLGQMLRSLEDPGRLERQRFDPPRTNR